MLKIPATLCRLGNRWLRLEPSLVQSSRFEGGTTKSLGAVKVALNHWICPAVNIREFCPQRYNPRRPRCRVLSIPTSSCIACDTDPRFFRFAGRDFVISALHRNGYAINLGLFSTIMSWFLHPEGVAKKRDEVDSMVPDPTNPDVMVSNKR